MADRVAGRTETPVTVLEILSHIGFPFSSVSYLASFLATRANTFPFVLANPILLI